MLNRNGVGGDLPREANSIGAIIDSLMLLLRGRSGAAVDQMQLVAIVLRTGSVVSDLGTVHKTERLAALLADIHTVQSSSGAIAGLKLLGIPVGLNRKAQLLSTAQRSILDVVGIQGGLLSAGRRLRDTGQTIPRNTLGELAGIELRIQNTVIYAGLILASTGLVPNQFRHGCFLLSNKC